MIQRLNYMISESTNPCVNLAMEEQLLDTVQTVKRLSICGRLTGQSLSEKTRMPARNVT